MQCILTEKIVTLQEFAKKANISCSASTSKYKKIDPKNCSCNPRPTWMTLTMRYHYSRPFHASVPARERNFSTNLILENSRNDLKILENLENNSRILGNKITILAIYSLSPRSSLVCSDINNIFSSFPPILCTNRILVDTVRGGGEEVVILGQCVNQSNWQTMVASRQYANIVLVVTFS